MALSRRWKRGLLWVPLLTLGAAAGLYSYATRPAALRDRVDRLARSLGLRVVSVGEIRLNPLFGLELHDVSIETASAAQRRLRERMSAPPLVHASFAGVELATGALLRGEAEVRSVSLREVVVSAIRDADEPSEASRVESAVRARPDDSPRVDAEDLLAELSELHTFLKDIRPQGWPPVAIQRADVQLLRARDGRLDLVRRWLADGTGQPATAATVADGPLYLLRLHQSGGSVIGGVRRSDAGTPLVSLSFHDGRIHASLDWLEVSTLTALSDESWSGRVDPGARVRLADLEIDEGGVRSCEIEFADLDVPIPIEDGGGPHFLQLTQASGTARFARLTPAGEADSIHEGRLQAAGLLNGAAVEAGLELRSSGKELKAVGRGADLAGGARRVLDGASEVRGEVRLRGFELPTRERDASFLDSESLPAEVRTFVADYDPRGPVNLTLGFSRKGPAAVSRPRFEAVLEASGASCRYFRFPYRVENVQGRVHFSPDGIRLEGLAGTHGRGVIRCDGRVSDMGECAGFELVIRGENIALDRDLYRALPTDYQRLWQRTDPVGFCDVRVEGSRPATPRASPPCGATFVVDAALPIGSVEAVDGLRLTRADADIHIEGDTLRIRSMHGFDGDAALRIAGTARPPDADGRERHDVTVIAANVPLLRSAAVPDSSGRPLGTLRFDGHGDVWTRLGGDATTAGGEGTCVRIASGRLYPFDGEPWTGCVGWLTMESGGNRIHGLRGQRPGGSIEISGLTPTDPNRLSPMDLRVLAREADAARLLASLLPTSWSDLREALLLGGAGEVDATLISRPSGAGEPDGLSIRLRTRAERMRLAILPIPLSHPSGELSIDATGVRLHQFRAVYAGNATVEVDGRFDWKPDDVTAELRLKAGQAEITPELVAGLPGPLRDLVQRLSLQGRADVALDSLRMLSRHSGGWRLAGRLGLQDARFSLGMALTEAVGSIEGVCELGANGAVTLNGTFSLATGLLDGRPVKNCRGRIEMQPNGRRVQLLDMSGQICDGQAVGFANVDPATGDYELSMTVTDVQLDSLLAKPGGRTGGADAENRVDGRVFLRGKSSDPGSRDGGGELRLRGSSLLSSAIATSLFEANPKAQSAAGSRVNSAVIRFAWRGDELQFHRVDILAQNLRLIGEGSWNMKSDAISLTLVSASSDDAPRLAILSDLLESASRELVQYRVEGTARSPRVKAEPMHNLTDPIRRLLGGN